LGRQFLIGLSVLLLVMCIGYTGWYFGHIEVFAEAKAQYSISVISQSKSKLELPKQTLKSQPPIPHSPSNTRFKTKSTTRTNTTQQIKQQVVRMDRLIKPTNKLNREQRRQTYSVAMLEEKNSGCRWTVGRLNELQRIINTGGMGRDSQFCGAYNKRLNELSKLNCMNQRSAFSGVCA